MTILLTQAIQVAGVTQPAGTTLTLEAGLEADLVTRKCATFVSRPDQGITAEVFARTDQLTGRIKSFDAAGVPHLLMPGYSAGTPVCDWTTNGTLSLVSANGGSEAVEYDSVLGMVKCTQGSSGTYIAQFVFTNPVYLAQMQSIQIPVRFEDNSAGAFTGSSNSLQLWLWDDATGTRQWRTGATLRALDAGELRGNATHVISMAPGTATQGWTFGGTSTPTNTSDMDAYTINRIRIVFVNTASGAKCWIGPITANARTQGCVSIVLDGQYSSQHNYILPMLEAQGLRASLALQHNQIGQSGRMTDDQLSRAYQFGHEFIHHTYDATKTNGYNNATDWPTQGAITADIQAGAAYQSARGWTNGIGYMVHGGAVNNYSASVSKARQDICTAAFMAANIKAIRRGSIAAGFLERLQNAARPSLIDPYTINGAVQITSTTTAADLTNIFTRVKNRGEWAIITVHRSVVSAPGSLEMLNSDFSTWISSLGTDVRRGEIEVRPFGEACRVFGITT